MGWIKTTVHVCGIDVEVEAEYTVSNETSVGLGPRHIEVESVELCNAVQAVRDFDAANESQVQTLHSSEIIKQITEAATEAVIEKIEEQER